MNIDCVKCGLRPAVSGGLCEECVSESIQVRLKDEISVIECRKCGAIQVGKFWHDTLQPESLGPEIKSHLLLNAPRLKLDNVLTDSVDLEGETITGHLSLEDAQGMLIEKSFNFPLTVGHQSCPRCNRISGSSFEAIVQLRTMLDTPSTAFSAITDKIRKHARAAENRKSQEYILKETKVRGGLDIYLGSRTLAEKIVHMAADAVLCNVVRTKKNFTRKDGQDIYRYTYLVRLMDIPRGKGIYVNEKEYIVVEATSSIAKLFDPVSNQIVEFKQGDFFRRRIRVSQNSGTNEYAEVLHCTPDGFTIRNPDGSESRILSSQKCKEGEKVELLSYRGKFYYLP